MELRLVFLLIALILFVIAALGIGAGRFSLIAAGLAFVVLAEVIG